MKDCWFKLDYSFVDRLRRSLTENTPLFLNKLAAYGDVKEFCIVKVQQIKFNKKRLCKTARRS